MKDRLVHAVVDLQFGSTGKGLLVGYLAEEHGYDTAVTAWMPNAGHTYVNDKGQKMVHTALANAIVSPAIERVLIAPGSVVDLNALKSEFYDACEMGYPANVYIHENAAVLTSEHQEWEKKHVVAIGSTQKGSMAAMASKLKRDPQESATAGRVFMIGAPLAMWRNFSVTVVTHREYLILLRRSERMILEGAQGYSLGINSGFWPYTTSRQCTVAQLCSDTLVPPGWITHTFGCARTFPIRVANRFADGKLVGWSGPCYDDQNETSFDDLGQKQEVTTVTKLPRRIFTWSKKQIVEAIEANQCGEFSVFLNFVNYLEHWGGVLMDDYTALLPFVADVRSAGARIDYIGTGPARKNVKRVNL
jgi:adenylosuccinate synthase